MTLMMSRSKEGEKQQVQVKVFVDELQTVHHLKERLATGYEQWLEYSLENTARLLSSKFPAHHVWIVLPCRHVHGALASYDNFARTDWASGGAVPEYMADGLACAHLEILLGAAVEALVSSSRRTDDAGLNKPDASHPLTLVGFSKGVVVLNQLVTELACKATQRGSLRHNSRRDGSKQGSSPSSAIRRSKRVRSRTNSSCERDRRVTGGRDKIGSSDAAIASGSGIQGMPQRDVPEEREKESGRQEQSRCTELNEESDRSCQEKVGWLWSRLLSFSMRPFSSASPPSSLSLGSTTDESHTNGDSDEGGWKDAIEPSRSEALDLPGRRAAVESAVPSHSPRSKFSRKRTRKHAAAACFPGRDGEVAGASRKKATPKSIGTCGAAAAAQRVFDRVKAIHWIDGGNGMLDGSFATNPVALAALAARSSVDIRLHGTPYQWGNPSRPWLAFERDAFSATLDELALTATANYDSVVEHGGKDGETAQVGNGSNPQMGQRHDRHVPRVKCMLYFEDMEPSLDAHFQILGELDPV